MSDTRFQDESAPALGVRPDFRTAAGHPVTIAVNVRNDAGAVRDITVSALGVEPSWLPPQERVDGMAPGETRTVHLVVTPASGTYPALYPLAISAQALDPRTGAPTAAPGMAEVHLTVNPRTELSVWVDPDELSMVYRKRFAVQVRNTGTEVASVGLVAQPSHGIFVHLASSAVDVAPGQTVRVSGSARVRKARMFGWMGQHQFAVTATGTDAVRHAECSVEQRPFVPAWGAKALALLTVFAMWAALAMFYLPEFGQWIREGALEAQRATGPGASTTKDGSGTGTGEGGTGTDPGEGPGAGGTGGTKAQTAASRNNQLQLTGTVTADEPGDVSVRLEPTSLVDEEAQGAVGIGISSTELDGSGLRLMSAFTRSSPSRVTPTRVSSSSSDGTWAFADVRAPGYYLLSFSKPGFQTRKYVVDSSSEAAKQPLEVEMVPGEGRLSGTIRGPGGPLGGAEVTISDGTHTVTTHSNTRGQVGAWSIEGLSTPSAYVVHASKHNYSSEARLVRLPAGGSATADLTLVAGVAMLTGRVSHVAESGKVKGLGGATVTVADSKGGIRTATTLTEGLVGLYTLPGLTAPGTYSVTISSPGYQAQTRRIEIRRGQTRVEHSLVLTSGSGTVTGIVYNSDKVGLEGAGLVLANAENTYKTTSISDPRGGFSFTGVTPGTYTLSTQFFGLVTDHVTVEVKPGKTLEINRVLQKVEGGVLPATSRIVGNVVDFATGQALLPCPDKHPYGKTCLTATVDDTSPVSSDGTSETTTYTTRFEPVEQYSLPKVGEDGGLRPGLHMVTITAPGYEVATIPVEVPRDTVVTAPLAQMHAVPKIQGRVVPGVGSPATPSCVWVVAGPPGSPTLPACDEAIAAGQLDDPSVSMADKCMPGKAYYFGLEAGLTRMCAATSDTNDYYVEVPKSGIYTIYVIPSDKEYADAAPIQVNAATSSTVTQNIALNRYARVTVSVEAPGPDNELVAVPGADVVVDPAARLSHPLTDAAGEVVVTGLAPGVHWFSAFDPTNPDQRGRRALGVDYNQTLRLYLPLTYPVPYLMGRVQSGVFKTLVPESGAQVTVEAPYFYDSSGLPIRGIATAWSQDRGCFAISSSAPVPNDTAECGDMTGAVTNHQFSSNLADRVTVTLDGYDQLIQDHVSFRDLTDFVLVPTRVPYTGGGLVLDHGGTVTAVDWRGASVVVSDQPTDTGTITVTLTDTTDTGANLVWDDSAAPGAGLRPGDYDIRVTVTGFAPLETTLTCAVGGTCGFAPDLVLEKLGAVEVTAVDKATGVALKKFSITNKKTDVVLSPTGNDTSVTFTDIVPRTTGIEFLAKSAGYEFVDTATTPGAMTCTLDGTSVTGVVIGVGATTQCTIELTRLGTISGTLVGVDVALSNLVALTNTRISAVRCTDATCDAVDPDSTLYGLTDTKGKFTITGTTDVPGVSQGTWRLKADEVPGGGYVSAGPTIVTMDGDPLDVTGVEVMLHRAPVAVRIHVTLDGAAVEGATVAISYDGTTTSQAPDAVTTDANGDADFTAIAPVPITITATKAGLLDESVVGQVFPDPLGTPPVVFDVTMSKEAGKVSGTVTEQTAGALSGVEVTIHCIEDAADPADTCDPAEVVLGTNDVALRTTTSATGGYTLAAIPPGTYTIKFTRAGYRSVTEPPTLVVDVDGQVVLDHTMAVNTRSGTFTLTTDNGDEDLAASRLDLVPVNGTAGTTRQYNFAPSSSGWTASLMSIPWGCYRVDLSLPAGHHGAIGALTGSPADQGLGCPAGALVVPRDYSTDPLAVGKAVSSATLTITTTVETYNERTGPGVAFSLNGPYKGTVDANVGGDVSVYVPPGTYTVSPVLSGVTTLFWNTGSQSTGALDATSPGDITFAFKEKTATVTISISDLPAGETPVIEIDPVPGQAWTVVTPLPDVVDGVLTVDLPEGSWLIRANYSTGPAAAAITISDPTPKSVVLEATP